MSEQPRPGRPFQRSRAGMTLVELLIVLGVVGIFAAIGYVSFRDQMIRSRLEEGAQVVARSIDRARGDARLENRVTSVGLTAGATSIVVDGRSTELPDGVEVAMIPPRPWLVFAPPFGAAFASADPSYDATDDRFAVQTVQVAWSAAPRRTQALDIVGTLGKPVLR